LTARWAGALGFLSLAVSAYSATRQAGLRPDEAVPLPAGFPVPSVPADNLFSIEKAELGRYLFYDTRLSATGTFACASCHQQALAFTDGQPTAIGATGQRHRRNTMSLTNVVYNRTFNWAEARTHSLEEQALVPMFGLDPIEMGMTGAEEGILQTLAADSEYQQRFPLAFPAESAPISIPNIVRAIATFERSLISFGSAYDRYVTHGDAKALSPSAERGLELFFSRGLGCSQCHSGLNLNGNTTWFERETLPLEFHNTGLYNLGRGRYPKSDRGRFEETHRKRDTGRFRAPTLRNIALTAPYMHDGSVPSLDSVLDHYSVGGRTVHTGPHRGIGRRNRYKSRLVKRLDFTTTQRADLLAFFDCLTDQDFVTDPRLANPRAPALPFG